MLITLYKYLVTQNLTIENLDDSTIFKEKEKLILRTTKI